MQNLLTHFVTLTLILLQKELNRLEQKHRVEKWPCSHYSVYQ